MKCVLSIITLLVLLSAMPVPKPIASGRTYTPFRDTMPRMNPRAMFFALLAGECLVSDADACKYIERLKLAGKDLTQSQKEAVNAFYVGLKADGVWPIIYDAGFLIWGAQAPNMVTLKGIATLTPVGSPVYSSTGTDFDGISSCIRTNINPSLVLSQDDMHVGYYSRETTAAGVKIMIGAETSANGNMVAIVPRNNSNQQRFAVNNLAYAGTATNSTTLGLYLATRTGPAAMSLYKNGAVTSTSTLASTGLPNNPLGIGASMTNAAAPYAYYDGQCAFWTAGWSTTATVAAAYNTRVETLLDFFGIGVQ